MLWRWLMFLESCMCSTPVAPAAHMTIAHNSGPFLRAWWSNKQEDHFASAGPRPADVKVLNGYGFVEYDTLEVSQRPASPGRELRKKGSGQPAARMAQRAPRD